MRRFRTVSFTIIMWHLVAFSPFFLGAALLALVDYSTGTYESSRALWQGLIVGVEDYGRLSTLFLALAAYTIVRPELLGHNRYCYDALPTCEVVDYSTK